MPAPLVSIVTPSYNQAEFLEHTLRSVLEQDYPQIEYLVVDGGSTDGSVEIIRKYAGRLAWWASERDQGQADAINKGFARARGEIIAWLNSDDLYLPGAVPAAVAALQAHPQAGLVFGEAITIDPEGRPLNRLAFGEWGLTELLRFRIICQPAVFMRRAVLERAGYLDLTYHFMLDHQLWLRVGKEAPLVHIPALWAAARHHPQAKNIIQAEGFSQETWRVLEWLGSQPGLAERLAGDRRRVEAGAYRLSARYLLDAGKPAPALRHYLAALRRSPRFALAHWHRMLYALTLLAGARGLAERLARLRGPRPPDLTGLKGVNAWPGLRV
jgi:glycosyltransferase involved in cell wall biosynthesis